MGEGRRLEENCRQKEGRPLLSVLHVPGAWIFQDAFDVFEKSCDKEILLVCFGLYYPNYSYTHRFIINSYVTM